MHIQIKFCILSAIQIVVEGKSSIDFKYYKDVDLNLKQIYINKPETLERSRRETVEENINPVTRIFVESLVNTIKPSLGPQASILEAFKPFLVSIGTGFIKEVMKFGQSMLDQGPFIDKKAFVDHTYEAYPVFIPSYGAFVLISKMGTIDLMKQKIPSDENYKEFNGKSDCMENCTVSDTKYSNSTSEIDNASNGKAINNESNDVPQNFYIGEAHLIPINGKTNSFESSRQVEDAYKNENGNGPVKEYIKQIMDTQMNIKTFKKRLLLSLLKKMEKAIRDL